MLQVGDKVVYPMHGAGVITGIEEAGYREQDYYVLRLIIGNMKVLVPVATAEELGVRNIIGADRLPQLEKILLAKPEQILGTWSKRFQAIQARMKSGAIEDMVAVLRDLVLHSRVRNISAGERRLLDMSKKIIISELSYLDNRTQEELEDWLSSVLANNKG